MISAKVLKPAEVNVSAYKNVAVADFDGPHGNDISRWIEGSLMRVRVDGEPYFKLVARDQLQKVMKEQSLQLSGAIDPSRVSQVGKVLGVDAIITGNVSSYRTEDNDFTTRRVQYYKCGDRTCTREYEVECKKREAYVSFNVNFIGVETGAIEASDSEEAQLASERCKGDSESLQASEKMLRQAADQCVERFTKKITPHYVIRTVKLRKDDDDAPWFFYSDAERTLSNKIRAGVEYAQAGTWKEAIQAWDEAVRMKPTCAACHYNLAIAYEMTGELHKAEELYQKAVSLKPGDSDYSYMIGHIKTVIQDAEALKAQLKGRGKKKE